MTQNTLGSVLLLGRNAYVPMALDPQITETGNLTVELWAFIQSMDPQANLVQKQHQGNLNYQLSLYRDDDGGIVCALILGSSVLTAAIPSLFNRWHHFAFTVETVDAISRLRLFINGEVVAETELAEPWQDGEGDAQLGKGVEGGLAEFRRWDSAFDAALVKAQRLRSLNGVEPHLVSYLPLDESVGIWDVVRRQHFEGVLHQWGEMERPFAITCTQVLFLDGVNDSVTADWPGEFPQQRLTIEFWYRSFHGTKGSVIVDYSDSGGATGLRIANPLNLTLHMADVSVQTGINLVDGRWQHVAMCWNRLSGRADIYLNGRKHSGKFTLKPEGALPTTGQLRVGAASDGLHDGFGGYLADLRCWATCRTADEIGNNFLNRQAGDEHPLRLYWPLAQLEGNLVETPMPHGPTGTLIGGRWSADVLAIEDSVAEQLRQLRYRAELYDNLPPEQPGDKVIGEPAADIGLAYEASAFVANLAAQLATVAVADFQLTDVDIEAKVLLSTDSSKIIVPYPHRLASLDPNHYSTLKFRFAPTYHEEQEMIKVPYLIGLTEPYAVAQLSELALGHRIVLQVVDNPASDGVVLDQQPTADTELDHHQPVTLIIGSATGN